MGRLRSGALRYTTVFAVTLLAIEFLDELVFGIREAAWPLIRTDLGLDYAQIGLLLGVPSVVSGLVEPVLGILGDIWRRRLLILGGGAVFALALLLTAQSPGFPALLTASILLYPASGAFVTLSQATLMDTDTARHEQNMARWTFAGSLGVVIGPLALGAAAAVGVLGWRGLFGLSAGLTLILLAIASRFQFAHGRSGPQRTDFRASMMDALQALQRGGVLRWLTLLQFSDLMMDVLLGFLALYLVDVGGAAPYQASAAVAVWTGLGLLGDLLLIPLLGRVRGLAYLRFSAAVELAVFAAFLLVSGIWTRLVLLGLLGLFNALFSGPVRSLLDRSLGMIHGRQRGLRIKLHIDPEDPSLAQLTSLPWEFLYRKETRDFLNLSRFTPILRYLDVQRPYTPLPLEPPLRILVVISAPIDYAVLDLHRERALIEASWARQEGVQVEFMAQATILALQDRLGEQPYHVLHYMGHGDFDERTGQGVLVMEDEGGRGALVDGSTLGVLLRDLRTMRLVFLNACETAKVTKEKGLDPFAGVAAAMVMAGIPAVVAIQFPISDGAAITFAQKFYPLLARGDPVDAAVAEGRRAIRLAGARTMEWGTPVLFMRAPQGVIFEVSEAQRAKVPLPEIPTLPEEMDEELEQRLAELYTRGLSAFWLEEWEKAARSFQAIVGVRPDYEDAADKLAEAKRQAKLHELYAQAQAAQEAENWSGSLAALEALAAEAVDYKDTAAMLEAVRKQKQLADLYAEAQRLHQAQQWQAVVNVLARIHAIEPDYADPDELLPTAEREAAEQKREARLDNLYSRAVRGMNAGRWQEARQLLAQVQEMEPGFRETERLLARVEADIAREEGERRRQEQIATLYEQALGLARDQQWQQVLATMEEIQGLDPQFADPEGLTARAQKAIERQRRLNALYAQAQAAQEADNWSGALSALEELVGEAADFRDAADLLEAAKKQKLLADLYAEAQQFHQAQQWQAVVNTFAQIHAIEPDYPDPEGLLSAAKREDAELKRQAELNDLYSRAVREMDAGRWQEARQLLAQVQEMEPGFREAEQLLVRAEEGIEREETERRRQEQTATLYEQALGLARARQWRQVLMKMGEIQTLDPEFADPKGIADRAQEEVAREEEEAQRQNELAALYAEAVRLLKAEQYQEALEKWGEVRTRDPRYPDRQRVQAKARKRLASLAKGAPPRLDLPRWAVVALGGLAVVAIVAAVVLLDLMPPRPFYDDFEDGKANDWDLQTGWSVELEGSNYVLSGSGPDTFATLESGSNWTDYSLKTKIMLIDGGANVYYRVSDNGRYFIALDEGGLQLRKESAWGTIFDLTSEGVPLRPNTWYNLEIAGEQGNIRVCVNDVLRLEYTDDDPLLQGTIGFSTWPHSRYQFDDVQVVHGRN